MDSTLLIFLFLPFIAGISFFILGINLIRNPEKFHNSWWIASWKGLFTIRPVIKDGKLKTFGTPIEMYNTKEKTNLSLKIKGYLYLIMGLSFIVYIIFLLFTS